MNFQDVVCPLCVTVAPKNNDWNYFQENLQKFQQNFYLLVCNKSGSFLLEDLRSLPVLIRLLETIAVCKLGKITNFLCAS